MKNCAGKARDGCVQRVRRAAPRAGIGVGKASLPTRACAPSDRSRRRLERRGTWRQGRSPTRRETSMRFAMPLRPGARPVCTSPDQFVAENTPSVTRSSTQAGSPVLHSSMRRRRISSTVRDNINVDSTWQKSLGPFPTIGARRDLPDLGPAESTENSGGRPTTSSRSCRQRFEQSSGNTTIAKPLVVLYRRRRPASSWLVP